MLEKIDYRIACNVLTYLDADFIVQKILYEYINYVSSLENMNLDPKMVDVLYHYTSHKSLRSIVQDRHLRISHVYYMNDENEIKYGSELLKTVVADRQNRETDHTVIEFLIEFREWLNQLIRLPHYIFVFSLTEKGNILSQWRAYTPSDGAGVSIGFSHEGLKKLATESGFELIKCLYDKNEQIDILNSELDMILAKFIEDAPSIDTTGSPPNQKFASYCYQHSEKLLKIFCRIKDPYFQEEKEWRLVSKHYVKYTNPEIKFRDGRTTLIPYIEFPLAGIHNDNRLFEQVYVGPSPNFNLAYSAIVSFLSNTKVCNVTINSQSPLRQI